MSRKTIQNVLRNAKTLALVAALGLGFAAPQAIAQAKQVIRISTPAVPDDWHAKMWTVFKDTLEKLPSWPYSRIDELLPLRAENAA